MSYFEILLIFISVKRIISSSFISFLRTFIKGSKPLLIAFKTSSQLSLSSIFLYILFSIKIFSKVELCHIWFNSSFFTFNSFPNNCFVKSVDFFKTSLTPIKIGLWFSIIQLNGDIETSQLVKAKRASIVLSGDTPEGKWINISTSDDVLSSIFLTLIFPLSFAFKIDSIRDDDVVVKGICEITRVFLLSWSILALTLILPPLFPSLYWVTSTTPPVGKSGKISNLLPLKYFIDESINSIKLWGKTFVDNPTAIPSAPWANSKGNFRGKLTGSFLLPS